MAVLEADATPQPDWLRRLYESAQSHAGFDVFSGRTHYGRETSWRRVLNLLDRSFDDRGASGEAYHVSNNGALYRAETIKSFPYPPGGSPFLTARLRLSGMRRAGRRFYFNRDALMRHAVGGIGFVWDFRRNTAYADISLIRKKTPLRILRAWARRAAGEGVAAFRLGANYLEWRDWPLWCAMFVLVRAPEAAGIIAAVQRRPRLERTAYR